MRDIYNVLLLDMDGPMAGFDEHGWNVCTDLGFTFDAEGFHVQQHRYFTEHLSPDEHRKARTIIEAPGWFRALPVVEGAQAGVEELLSAGVEIWVCTKPLEANPGCRDEKGAWLREHFPMLERNLIITPDKSLIRGNVLLDDAIKIEWIQEADWAPMVFTAPFNGPGSEWAHLPHWTWGDDIEELMDVWGRWTRHGEEPA